MMSFLRYFPKDSQGYMIYELYSFDNFFRLLLKHDFDYEGAISFVMAACSLSAVVFQERIHNKGYLNLFAKDALLPKQAAVKSRVIFDILDCCCKG